MSLSINPLAQLVAKVTAETKTAIAAIEAAAPDIQNALDKAQLDAKIARLSGDLGSGLNQATSGGIDLGIDQITTGMGNVSNTVSSSVGGNSITSLTSNVGSFGGNLQNIAALTSNAGADITSTLSKLTGGSLASGVQNLASGISKGAGVLNNLLSLRRGANIPKGGELFSTTGEGIALQPSSSNDWRVRINCAWEIFESKLFDRLKDSGGVVFPILPEITFSTKANYTQIDPVHNNYPFQAYKNSQVDEIQINGKFTAETEIDAAYWIAATTFFRTATKMFFGKGDNVGSPPIICKLSGYGANIFDNVPVVVKSFSVDLPADVNYVRCSATGTPTWVPIVSNINVSVQPVYNRRNLRQFSLKDYAAGSIRSSAGAGYL